MLYNVPTYYCSALKPKLVLPKRRTQLISSSSFGEFKISDWHCVVLGWTPTGAHGDEDQRSDIEDWKELRLHGRDHDSQSQELNASVTHFPMDQQTPPFDRPPCNFKAQDDYDMKPE